MVVFDVEEAGIEAGLYRILAYPVYIGSLLGGSFLCQSALTWMGYLPSDRKHAENYPCGFLCTACQQKALDFLLYTTRCGVAALAA